MSRETIKYWIGMTLVGIVGTIMIPFYGILIGVIRIGTLLLDTFSFPYSCMCQYHYKFELNKKISEAIKDIQNN